jgi:hypothetical protein
MLVPIEVVFGGNRSAGGAVRLWSGFVRGRELLLFSRKNRNLFRVETAYCSCLCNETEWNRMEQNLFQNMRYVNF